MRLTNQQVKAVVEFMCANPEFAREEIRLLSENNKLWAELTELANSKGPPFKTTDQWIKVHDAYNGQFLFFY